MGQYLNPTNDAFAEAVNDDIYVDKTELISITNRRIGKSSKYICVSRPRRFGKSMAANMLTAYYSKGCNSKEIFNKLKIANDDNYQNSLNKYDVIHLNIQQFLTDGSKLDTFISNIKKELTRELKRSYGNLFVETEMGLSGILSQIYENSDDEKKGFIFILDEWDCVFREAKEDKIAQKEYLDFLKDLFKDRTYVKLAYVTGILPIKKYGTHSALNIFEEFSMIDQGEFACYTGFTEQEVKLLCDEYNMEYQTMQKWYDGYILEGGIHIYSPRSVVGAVTRGKYKNYWTQTETYEALKVYIEMNYDGLKDAVISLLEGGRVYIDVRKFQNDMTTFSSKDDVMTLLIHLGYLAYDQEMKEVYIPNKEVHEEFAVVTGENSWKYVIEKYKRSEEILFATLSKDNVSLSEMLEEIHEKDTSVVEYNNENSLSSIINIAYYSATRYYYQPIREYPTGKGYADIVFLPRRECDYPAMLIELKWDKSANAALEQIKDRKYPNSLLEYSGKLLLVGINYDKATKKHDCMIEEYVKKK